MWTFQFDRRSRGRQGNPLITVMNDLDRATGSLAKLANVALWQCGVASVDVADDVRICLEDNILINQARSWN
jgi:hypothetical protein